MIMPSWLAPSTPAPLSARRNTRSPAVAPPELPPPLSTEVAVIVGALTAMLLGLFLVTPSTASSAGSPPSPSACPGLASGSRPRRVA
ncbi:hypothetical protein ACP4OV_025765 [Aristida adscensionis]